MLEPLRASDADRMFEVLSDPAIYDHLDYGPPASLDHLRSVYAKLERRTSPDGKQKWLNWIAKLNAAPIGYLQATVDAYHGAWVAYVLASRHWGCGYATEAMRAMLEHLSSSHAVDRYFASAEAENSRSIRLLERLSFRIATAAEHVEHGLSASERLFVRHERRLTSVFQ